MSGLAFVRASGMAGMVWQVCLYELLVWYSRTCGGRSWKIEYAYHTRILLFEEYVRILTYSIIAYAYARALAIALQFQKLAAGVSWQQHKNT